MRRWLAKLLSLTVTSGPLLCPEARAELDRDLRTILQRSRGR